MWQEARKQEKKVRCVMNNMKKRAERKREFYDSIRQDPASYLQIHGHKMKVHIDPVISTAAEQSLVPWMGDPKNMIDRFDVRAHLDHIPAAHDVPIGGEQDFELTKDQEYQLNYYRYKKLVQNDFLHITEAKCLQQIEQAEMCDREAQQARSLEPPRKKVPGKTIGYVYEDSTELVTKEVDSDSNSDEEEEEEEEETLSGIDNAILLEPLTPENTIRLNYAAVKYGLSDNCFTKFLQADLVEAERLKIAKDLEAERSMFNGRKGKRERKTLKQQNLLILRSINVADDHEIDHFNVDLNRKKISTKTVSSEESADEDEQPVQVGKIEFITTFGSSSSDDEAKISTSQLAAQLKKAKKGKINLKEELPKITKTFESPSVVAGPKPPPIFGPMLPDLDNEEVRFKSTRGQSRHYRGDAKGSGDDSDEKRMKKRRRTNRESPSTRYVVSNRRSPSIRRRSSSSSSSSRSSTKSPPPARRRSRSRSRSKRQSNQTSHHRRSPRRQLRRSRSRSISRAYQNHRNRSRSLERSPRPSRRSRSRSPKATDRRSTRDRQSRSREDRDRRRETYRRRRSRSRSRSSRDRHRTISKRSRSRSIDRSRGRTDKRFKDDKLVLKNNSLPVVEVKKNGNSNIGGMREEKKVKKTISPSKTSKDIEKMKPKIESISLPFSRVTETVPVVKRTPPPIRRYYRHDLDKVEDDDEDLIDAADKVLSVAPTVISPPEVTKPNQVMATTMEICPIKSLSITANSSSSSKPTAAERMKRLMQAQIDKQARIDQKATAEKMAKEKKQQLERNEKLSELNEKRQRRALSRSRSKSRSSSASSSSSSASSSSSSTSSTSSSNSSKSSNSGPRHRIQSRSPERRGKRSPSPLAYRSRRHSSSLSS